MSRLEPIQQLMGTFLEELEEVLASVRLDLTALAEAPNDSKRIELHESLYRGMHTLKGAARVVEQELIGSVCQLLEQRLKAYRSGGAVIDEETSALLNGAVEALAEVGERLRRGERLDEGGDLADVPIAQLLQRLEGGGRPSARNHPRAAAAPAAATSSIEASWAGAALGRILVAEDSITLRAMARTNLEAAGYEVRTATNGIEALQILDAHIVDLVVSDVEMPGLDGLGLTSRIRSSERLRALPVVLLTSLDRPEDRQRGLAAGADAYLVKGDASGEVLGRALLDVVEKLLSENSR